jgi:predicted SnoaL-like aldol condensation-catalyzing enzyme
MTSSRIAEARTGLPGDQETRSNSEIATEFLTLASAGRARDAWREFVADDFIHHNPGFSGDAESLIAAMDVNAAEHPGKSLVIQRVIAEGPLVAVHSRVHLDRGGPTVAAVHIFRIESGRIRELWDVAQPVPADSPNENGMF